MIKIINECVDCGLPCIGNACMYQNQICLECDCCGEEVEELYEYSSEQYCSDCILKNFNKIDPDYYLRNEE